MRTLMLGVLVGFGILLANPANAYDWQKLRHQCRHGNQHACHLIHLRHKCERGDHRACHALRR